MNGTTSETLVQHSQLAVHLIGLQFNQPIHCNIGLGQDEDEVVGVLQLAARRPPIVGIPFQIPWTLEELFPLYERAEVTLRYQLGAILITIGLYRKHEYQSVQREHVEDDLKSLFYIRDPVFVDMNYADPRVILVQ
ncbi:MAG: hypothetical protein U0517_03730 [Candidatus Andersenbacteria bacterium]